jgi:hypothetical protein
MEVVESEEIRIGGEKVRENIFKKINKDLTKQTSIKKKILSIFLQ